MIDPIKKYFIIEIKKSIKIFYIGLISTSHADIMLTGTVSSFDSDEHFPYQHLYCFTPQLYMLKVIRTR